ncbi:MAG: type II secretion system protein [Pseudomonadota bacterium]
MRTPGLCPLRRRRRHERGFSLVEAVVALTISALTLALLSGAAFSLRAIGARSEAADEAVDLMAARRVVQRFASETVLRGAGNTAGFVGGPSEMRLLLGPDLTTGTPGRLVVLRVERNEGHYLLTAYRETPAASVWAEVDGRLTDRSEVMESAEPLRFAYLIDNPEGGGALWVAEHRAGSPPQALAIRVDGGPTLTARFAQELDPGCLAAAGLGQFERNRCLAR